MAGAGGFVDPWAYLGACSTVSVAATTLADVLLERVRDAGGKGISRAFALRILSRCLDAVACSRAHILRTDTITVTARQPFYSVAANLTEAGRVIEIRFADRTLDFVPWHSALCLDEHVLDLVGPRPETWTIFGRDLLVILPLLRASASIDVISTSMIVDSLADGDCVDGSDPEHDEALRIAEAVLSIRRRDVARAITLLEGSAS